MNPSMELRNPSLASNLPEIPNLWCFDGILLNSYRDGYYSQMGAISQLLLLKVGE